MKNFLTLFIVMISVTSFSQDWPNLEKYKEANKPYLNGSISAPEVVFMGNSITEGWVKKFPEFFSENNYAGRGISGQTTPQMLVRFRQDVIALNPKAVVILAGTNDIAGNTGPSTIEMIADNIFSMCEIAEANNIKVIISSVLPVYDYPWKPGLEPSQKIIDLNKMLKAYAKKNKHTYLDYHKAMKDDRNGMKPEYSYDEVHCTKEGYEVMIKLVSKAIKKVL